jgi:hypothetical protein
MENNILLALCKYISWKKWNIRVGMAYHDKRSQAGIANDSHDWAES